MVRKPKEKEEDRRQSISIKLPDDIVQWLDEQAEAETRTRSNFIEVLLKEAKARRGDPMANLMTKKG